MNDAATLFGVPTTWEHGREFSFTNSDSLAVGEVVLIPVYETRSVVSGLSLRAFPSKAFTSPHDDTSATDHPRAMEASPTLEFARIARVHPLSTEGEEQLYDVVAGSYPDGRCDDLPRSSIARIILDQARLHAMILTHGSLFLNNFGDGDLEILAIRRRSRKVGIEAASTRLLASVRMARLHHRHQAGVRGAVLLSAALRRQLQGHRFALLRARARLESLALRMHFMRRFLKQRDASTLLHAVSRRCLARRHAIATRALYFCVGFRFKRLLVCVKLMHASRLRASLRMTPHRQNYILVNLSLRVASRLAAPSAASALRSLEPPEFGCPSGNGAGKGGAGVVPIGLESEPQMGQRVILASDVPRYVLEATLHGNGCTLTRGEYASSVVEPHEGAPATMLDLWQGGMLGTVVGLDGVGSLTRKRRQDLLMPREHRWMADALSFKSRHFVAQAQSALAAPLPPAVWLSKGRALATACVAWDGDCRQHAEERGEGSWGMSNVREGSDPDRVSGRERARTGYLLGLNKSSCARSCVLYDYVYVPLARISTRHCSRCL